MPAAASAKPGTAGYQIFSLAESARAKGMWAGALERTPIPGLAGAYPEEGGLRLREIPRPHTPAVLKIIDEAVVNASDHAKEHEKGPAAQRVKNIGLAFDAATGTFSVENDGPGIPVVPHEQATAAAGHPVYVPEVAFAHFLAGRNMEKPLDSVKGGINGIGAKLINVHSAVFAVETTGAAAGGELCHYAQVFERRMVVRHPPATAAKGSAAWKKLAPAARRPHTRVVSTPAFSALGYGAALAPADAADIEAWFRWRACLLAAYVGPKVAVTFNGAPVATTSARLLAEVAVAHDPEAVVFDCAAKAKEGAAAAHPWSLAVAILPSAKKFGQLSVINGVHCASGGTHVQHLKGLLGDAVAARLNKATKSKDKKVGAAEATRQVFLVAVGALPGADWGGQRKDELQVAKKKVGGYAIPPRSLAQVAEAAAARLLAAAEKAVRGKKRRITADKYVGARKAGTKDSARCSLLAAEGDSAITLLRAGLTLGPRKNPEGPSFEHYGVFSLGGVIMNALKQVTEAPTAGGGAALVRSEKLRNNKVLAALVEVLGLDFTCAYRSDEEVARLRYGAVIVATDQDLDGTGKILPLVLVWFHVFWPNLIARGYVKRYVTPVIRAYPAGKKKAPPLEFYYENEYAEWAAGAPPGKHAVKYYKGLATHDDEEVVAMFRAFAENVHTFTLDDEAAATFRVFFGADTAPRKAALSTPVRYPSAAETRRTRAARRVACSDQLRVDGKAYKLDDIERKIPSVADGIPVARRKVLAGALRRFAAKNNQVKVFQLGGYVAEHMFYHHGDASLNATIVGMAQRFPGALQFPYLSGIGQFGSRHAGGGDAGSPRYINVRLAAPFARAMFPAADTWLLPHVFEDGERAQPSYFLGVLPAPLLESFEIPSEGWRHLSFARDLADVLALLRAYVAGEPRVLAAAAAGGAADPALRAAFPLRVSTRGYGGEGAAGRGALVRPHQGQPHSFGRYLLAPGRPGAAREVRVTELPLKKTTDSFLRDLKQGKRARLIEAVDNYSPVAGVDVRIRLAPGAYEKILAEHGDGGGPGGAADPLEEFLLLRRSLRPFLNYYGEGGGVLEFGEDYHAVFFHWAPLRRDLYRRRLEREEAVLALRARKARETVRFISAKLDLAALADEGAACARLAELGYPLLDSALIEAPRHTPTADLERLATAGPGASFSYLLNLRARDLVEEAKDGRARRAAGLEEALAAARAALAEEPFAGASLWAAEIAAVEAAVALGEKTAWRFD